MKKIIIALALFSFGTAMTSCELDRYPETSYTEHNYEDTGESDEAYSTREDMSAALAAMYSGVKSAMQEAGYLDLLVATECRTDNAYNGNPATGGIVALEANSQDPENVQVTRDWNYYLDRVSSANQIICYIDAIKEKDSSMTQEEHDSWKAQALAWRAYNLFLMTQLWGDIPVQTIIPPAITAENIDEVYDLYYLPRKPVEEVYAQIIEDLEFACQHCPEMDPNDKFVFSKPFANGLAARVYAEKPRRDWDKVIAYCEAVEATAGLQLVENYEGLWSYTLGDAGDAVRNTSESIFEVTWSRSSGNWVWFMFYRNAYSPNDSFTWTKWVTPSRNLIKAFQDAGDTERLNASVKFDACGWSHYYPKGNYAFMYKLRTNASSMMIMRLAEIYLLHAEALTMSDTKRNLGEAANYVNKVRKRAKLDDLPTSAQASPETMIDAILAERRLELAFEGFRWFDLVRHDKIKEVHASVNQVGTPAYDSYFMQRYLLTDETMLLPVPTTAIDKNSNLVQNPGY